MLATLASIAVAVLPGSAAPAEHVGEPACVSDAGYARVYAELRARWVRFGGISGGSIASDARVRVEAAALLARRAPELAAHARVKRAATARLRAWTAAELDGESSLAFYARALVTQSEEETGRVEWLARAVTNEATRTEIAAGTRVLEAFLRAHPDLDKAPSKDLREGRWGSVPWEDRRKLIEVRTPSFVVSPSRGAPCSMAWRSNTTPTALTRPSCR